MVRGRLNLMNSKSSCRTNKSDQAVTMRCVLQYYIQNLIPFFFLLLYIMLINVNVWVSTVDTSLIALSFSKKFVSGAKLPSSHAPKLSAETEMITYEEKRIDHGTKHQHHKMNRIAIIPIQLISTVSRRTPTLKSLHPPHTTLCTSFTPFTALIVSRLLSRSFWHSIKASSLFHLQRHSRAMVSKWTFSTIDPILDWLNGVKIC